MNKVTKGEKSWICRPCRKLSMPTNEETQVRRRRYARLRHTVRAVVSSKQVHIPYNALAARSHSTNRKNVVT